MDMSFDPTPWAMPRWNGPADGSRRRPFPARLDWPELAARLAAAHAFQRHAGLVQSTAMVTNGAFMFASDSGSFHDFTARILAGFSPETSMESSTSPPVVLWGDAGGLTGGTACRAERKVGSESINPTSSGDRKNSSGKVNVLPAPSLPAIEG